MRTFKIYFLSNFQAYNTVFVFVVQLLSHVWLFVTPLTAAHRASLSLTISWSLLKLMSIESVLPSNHLVLCHPLLLLPSIFPNIRVFSNVLALRTKKPKYWSFSFSISPSNEYSGLISFRMDWFDLLAAQGTLRSLQHQSSCVVIWLRNHFESKWYLSQLGYLKFNEARLSCELKINSH